MQDCVRVAPDGRILIVKLSAIGDVIMTTPVAKALRAAFPGAYIAWVVEPKSRDILIGNPYLDEVIVWDRPADLSWNPLSVAATWKSLRALGRELRSKRFDVAVDLQGLLRSALVAKSSGAKCVLGFDSGREGSTRLYTHLYPLSLTGTRGPQRYLDALRLLGVHASHTEMCMPLTEDDRAYARRILDEETARHLPDRRLIAALAPATTWPHKHWTEEGWAGLADGLIARYEALPVFLGSSADVNLIGRIRGLMTREPGDVVGRTTLKQAGAVLEEADLVFGVDTGLLHMSIALGRPTIGIFGPTRWRHLMRGELLSVVVKEMDCIPCMRHPTCTDFACMRAITSDEVLSEAGRRLARILPAR
ncbi:MAG: glycosyltransferase family 9 protein [Armatimonadetes bacterium]|nr:glycosyltransferase family 9 protein [Armatimonadota bacterium]